MRILAVVALLAPATQEEYLPLREGTRWTYEVEDRSPEAADSPREVTAEAGEPRAIAGEGWTPVSNFLGYPECFLRATGSAIEFRIEAAESAPVLPILALPAQKGRSWTGTLGREEIRFLTEGEEDVEAGEARLRALHVSFTVASPEKHAGHAPTRGDLWFAPGIGIIRAQVTRDLDCHSASTKLFRLKR
jgi:hypothetical protein